MASGLYTPYTALLMTTGLNLSSLTIKAALIDSGTYTVDFTNHNFWDDASAGVVGTPVALASKTTAARTFDAADTTISSVTGATVEAVIIYNDTGVASTSDLLVYIDGLSVTPNGGDIVLQWNATNGIFKFAAPA